MVKCTEDERLDGAEEFFDIIEVDEEALEEFLVHLYEHIEHIEHDLHVLESKPGSVDALNSLYASLCAIRHRCEEMVFDPLTAYLVAVEAMVCLLIKQGETCSLLLKEAFFLAMDQFKYSVEVLIQTGKVPLKTLNEIRASFSNLVAIDIEARERKLSHLVENMSGLEISEESSEIVCSESEEAAPEEEKNDVLQVQASIKEIGVKSADGDREGGMQADLKFFEVLSRTCDLKASFWHGRTQQILKMAIGLNEVLANPVDDNTLRAAVYTHDLGMIFIPDHILNKQQKFSDVEADRVRVHVKLGYEIVVRMRNWREAAEIVYQHHERIDGQGYPSRLAGNDIHIGAKIMAVCDAFFSITNARPDRCHKRSVLRAAKEINLQVGTQFDQGVVRAFNECLSREFGSRSKSSAA